jgi:LacI family transcriptional regulator
LEQFGYRIPGDVSIIGFDNIQSHLAIPFRLSTINPHKTTISNTAVNCLVDIMRRNRSQNHHILIDTDLVPGETVRNVSGNCQSRSHNPLKNMPKAIKKG